AAGMSLPLDNLSEFRDNLNEWMEEAYSPEELKEQTIVHLIKQTDEVTIEAIQEMKQLAPFGNGNEKPVFMIKEAEGKSIRQIGSNSQHVKLVLSQHGSSLDAVGFNMPLVV